jgi:hypothetical protein
MLLLLFDEVVISAKFTEHGGCRHCSAVGFVEKMRWSLTASGAGKYQRKQRVRLHGQSLDIGNLVPQWLRA